MWLNERWFAREVPYRDLQDTIVPEPGKWADRLYCHTAKDMHHLPDDSIALEVTSPWDNVILK